MSNPAEEPKQVLCMLSFTDDGTVRWKSSIGSAPKEFVQRIIRIYRASVSIASAFLSISDDTDGSPSANVQQPDERRKEEPVFAQCENDTVILAMQIRSTPDTWFALIARPLVLPRNTVCHDMLTALENLAKILSPPTQGEKVDLYEFCNSICMSLTSAFFWNDRARISHFMDSLLKFCDRQNEQRKEQCRDPSAYSENTSQSLQTALAQPLEAFHTAVCRQFGASQVRMCIFRADMKALYAETLDSHEIALLGWYFSTFLNLGLAAWSNIFSRRDKRGSLHVWYKRRGLILFTSFLCTKGDSDDPAQSLRKAADTLIDATSRAVINR